MVGVVIVGAICLLVGIVMLAKPEAMWALTEWRNEMRGVASERTAWWDVMNTIGGIVAVVAGIALILVAAAV